MHSLLSCLHLNNHFSRSTNSAQVPGNNRTTRSSKKVGSGNMRRNGSPPVEKASWYTWSKYNRDFTRGKLPAARLPGDRDQLQLRELFADKVAYFKWLADWHEARLKTDGFSRQPCLQCQGAASKIYDKARRRTREGLEYAEQFYSYAYHCSGRGQGTCDAFEEAKRLGLLSI